jgi:hypothetical protein
MVRLIPRGWSWSLGFSVAFAVVSTFPTFSGPFPFLSLDTIEGKVLYLATVLSLAVGWIIAQTRENAARDVREVANQQQNETLHRNAVVLSDKRHEEDMAANARMERDLATVKAEFAKLHSAIGQITALQTRGTPTNAPDMQAFMETVRKSVATIEGIVLVPHDSPFKFTAADIVAYPAESKTPILIDIKQSSSSKPKS